MFTFPVISKFVSIVLFVVSLFTVNGNPSKVDLSVEDMTTASTVITYTYANETGKPIYESAYIVSVEKKEDGNWVALTNGTAADETVDLENSIMPKMACTQSAVLGEELTVDTLEAGTYRLTIEYVVADGFGNAKHVAAQASTEFTVREA